METPLDPMSDALPRHPVARPPLVPTATDKLGPAERLSALDSLDQEVFDVVIIGGGVTGTGCALDAATRGLRVALVEQRDFASGTSSRSSKLIHGGLRYLEQLNFRLVREALKERGLMLASLAPHLVQPVPFLYPLRHRIWERAYVGAGVMLYDLLASKGGNPLPRHKHLSKRAALREAPALDPNGLVGAVKYWDAQTDDARHTLALARTAAGLGAVVASSVRALGLLGDGTRVAGIEARCLETGRDLTIRGRAVINATGVWMDRIQQMTGEGGIRVRASKGIHLVIPRERIVADTGLIVRTEESVLFVIPWGDFWLVGTTDTDWALDLAHPAASRADIDYLLERVNRVLSNPITQDDIVGVYAGLRPLLSGESDATSKLSREHAVSVSLPGLVTVAGGKYTTYRVMAEDAVDAVSTELGRNVPKSASHETPLIGAEGYHALVNGTHRLAQESGLGVDQIQRLLGRHGSRIHDLLALIADEPELAKPLEGGEGYLAAEVLYAATHEGALHLDDVLTRRTRISIETWDRGLAAAEPVAQLMARVLGWDDKTAARELEHYRARVSAERDSQTMADDHTADGARMGAPDVRTSGKP